MLRIIEMYERAPKLSKYEDLIPLSYHSNSIISDDNFVVDLTFTSCDIWYKLKLPIFVSLLDKELNSEGDTSNDQEDVAYDKSFYDKFWSIIFKPKVIGAVFTILLLILINLALTIAIGVCFSPLILGTPLIVAAVFATVGLLFAAAYFPMAKYYHYAEKQLKPELLDYFKKTIDYFENGYVRVAVERFYSIPSKYKILLHKSFPNNSELKWYWYYLQALLLERRKFTGFYACVYHVVDSGLALSKTNDQKFIFIKFFINIIDQSRKEANQRTLGQSNLKSKEFIKNTIEKVNKNCKEQIKPYFDQISKNSKLHIEYAKQIQRNLRVIIEHIKNEDIPSACDKFFEMEWNGYCKAAFPAAAIMYYQIETILYIASEADNIKFDDKPYRVFFQKIKDNFKKIQRNLDEHFPDKLADFQMFADGYYEFCKKVNKVTAEKEENYVCYTSNADPSIMLYFNTKLRLARSASLNSLAGYDTVEQPMSSRSRSASLTN